jgi:hypothetical protein
MAMIDWEDRTPRCKAQILAYCERRKLRRSGNAIPAVISLIALALQGFIAVTALLN